VLLMGGYGFAPVFEVVLGSVVDEVLRESQKPVLICR
jgi:nucleotide-binding universal stress UspA family protein